MIISWPARLFRITHNVAYLRTQRYSLIMPAKAVPTDLPIHPFASASDFEAFLEREHATAPGIHLMFAKKASGIASISGREAVEVALCFGWIDGQANSFDDKYYLIRYTPRRPKSIWSKINVETVARLTEAGKMRPAGIAAVEAAKVDGRWDRAYAGPATVKVPDDFAAALAAVPDAAAFFETLNKGGRYAVLWRVHTVSPKTRAARIQAFVKMLEEGKVPGDSGKDTKATKAQKVVELETEKVATKGSTKKRVHKEVTAQDNEVKRPRRAGLRSLSRRSL